MRPFGPAVALVSSFLPRLALVAAPLAFAAAALAAPAPAKPAAEGPASAMPAVGAETHRADRPDGGIDADRLFDAIVKVEARAVPGARSTATLGREREGSGVVIGDDGLVLTIGYLVVEAEEVQVTDRKGRKLPARVVGYDHATGLGLVRPLVPVKIPPVPLGDSEKLGEREPVLIASQADGEEVSFVRVISRRPFSGSWEYLLERAIWTSPAAMNWSGAALIDRDGRLVGVGSLVVRDASPDGSEVPGNVFVPIEVLKPILADLAQRGRRAGPARPWLGLSAEEAQGRLLVTRVTPGGPADRAGMKAGDIVLGVARDPVRTQADFYRKVWAAGNAGDEIPLRVLQDVDVREIRVRSIDRVDFFRAGTSY